MKSQIDLSIKSNLRHDIPAGIVVFLVAVPLCLGIAMASGAPLFSGIISGIVGGIVVGFFSGSQLGVSGPAAGLAAIVLTGIQELGAFDIFLLAVVISGLLQLIFGWLQAGIIAYYFPNSVIKAMLAGIGIIIILKELPYAIGYQAESGSLLDTFKGFAQNIEPGVLFITGISLVILILWEQPFIKRLKFARTIQAPLVVVVLGVVLYLVFQNTSWALKTSAVVALPVADGFTGFINQFTLPDFSQWNNPQVYTVALTIAAIGSIESLLCMEATDKLDPFKRVSPANTELKAQGIGNLIAGLLGGIPVVQVIVRGTTNIQSGGRTKMAAIMHGVLLLLCVMLIPHLLNLIPLASLAAILLMVGYKLTKPALYKLMYQQGVSSFVPFIITILVIVFKDLLMGVGVGLAVAMFFILYNSYKRPFILSQELCDQEGHTVIKITLPEEVSFLNKAHLQKALNLIPNHSHVELDASKSKFIDPDIIEIIDDFVVHCTYSHIRLDYTEKPKDKVKKISPLNKLENLINDLKPHKDKKNEDRNKS
jgi:MFS superfamily sulfate permease-like transporter